MNTSTLVINHLKSNLASNLNTKMKQFKHNLTNLNQFHIGVLTCLASVLSMQLVYTICMSSTSLFFLVIDVVKVALTLFSIFSLFTWLHIFYGRNWSDTSVFLLFLSCFMSEFFIQLVSNEKSSSLHSIDKKNSHKNVNNSNANNQNTNQHTNHKHNSLSNDWKYSNIIYLSNELAQYVFILFVCTLANSVLNSKLMKNFLFILSLCIARFCGFIYLFDVIPLSVNAYLTYLCAFAGVLFSHYIHKTLNEFNSTHNFNNNVNINKYKPRIEINLNDDMNNNFNKMTAIYNNHKYTSQYSMRTSNSNANITNTNKTRRKIGSLSDSFKRRTSLPTISFKTEKMNSGNAYLDEIVHLIDDILNKKNDISLESIYQNLESIKQIIHLAKMKSSSIYNESCQKQHFNTATSSQVVTHQTINFNKPNKNKLSLTISSAPSHELKSNCIGLSRLHSNSYSADEDDENRNTLSVFYNGHNNKNRMRRSLPTRSPSLAWSSSTTTSANGMPIVENVSTKQRSSSLKLPGFISHNLFLNVNSSIKDLVEEKQTENTQKCKNISKSDQIMNSLIKKESNSDDDDEETTAASSLTSNTSNKNTKTSDYDSGESPNSSDYNSDSDKLQLKDLQYQYSALSVSNKKLDEIREENSNVKLPWQASEIKHIQLLEYLHDWNFPIFQLNEKTDNHILSKMAFKIFDRVGLFKSFDIPIDAFILYFSELENGYIDLPYHNKMHAADVLHACYYLTTQPVPNFSQIDFNGKERQSLKHFHNSTKYKLNNEPYGSIGANFDPLELLALYCASAMHDFDHPGRNNQFLVRINSPLALLYNDRSVLENHHAAASWKLFKSNSKFNFLSGLDAAELKRFRFLVIENILATDLNKHFAIINEFNSIVKSKNGSSSKGTHYASDIDWTNESDRLIISKMIIKLADINSPLKERELHLQWTERICEEFYQQGEEEMSLGIPISAFMDRKNPQVAKLQENFMSGLVGSLSDAYTSAGLLPGILIEDSHLATTDEMNDSDVDVATASQTLKRSKNTKIFYSELTSNFKTNYEMWCELTRQEQNNHL